MKLEINIPDSTHPDLKAKISEFADCLSARPELIEEISYVVSNDTEIQKIFTPEVLAELDLAVDELNSGKGLTLDQVRMEVAETRAQWLARNPT